MKASECGGMLKRWRAVRRVSQLGLATRAGVSTRHLSFVESGRSRASREMLITLAEALEVPLRERNALLAAGGFAPVYRQSGIDSPEIAAVLTSLEAVLERMGPYPCVVMSHLWEVHRANPAAVRLFGHFIPPELLDGPLNLVRLLFTPALRPSIRNFAQLAPAFAEQLRREVLAGDGEAERLLEEVLAQPGVPKAWGAAVSTASLPPVIPLELEKGDLRLSLFSVVSTLGTPQDVTLQELRMETFLPADTATAGELERLARDA